MDHSDNEIMTITRGGLVNTDAANILQGQVTTEISVTTLCCGMSNDDAFMTEPGNGDRLQLQSAGMDAYPDTDRD